MQRKVRKMEDRLLFSRINCEERLKKRGRRGSGRLKISTKRLLLEVCVCTFEALAANA